MEPQTGTDPARDPARELARRAEELGLPLELFLPLPGPEERLYADVVDRSDPDGQAHRNPFLDTDIYRCSGPEGLIRRCLDAAAGTPATCAEALEVVVLDSSLALVARISPEPRYKVVRESQRTFRTGDVEETVLVSGLPEGVARARAREADAAAREAGALAVHRAEPE